MKRKISFIIGFLILAQYNFAQNLKTNPIMYAEIIVGYSNGSIKGATGGATLNFQTADNLFTYRHLEISQTKQVGTFIILPILVEVQNLRENAIMYGKRIIDENTSYSYSAGISLIDNRFLVDPDNNLVKYDNVQNVGFPFELNIKWFNSKKSRYRIYELIPIGQPVSFANSIGFKLYGSLSKTSFIGIGLTLGLGWHKNY